tara:strand:- start:271 stop:1128 length:858 start_codon:yes stop_codon:yes gene_type:complete
MNIIIFGASGMLGQALSQRCKHSGFTVYECTSKTVDITQQAKVNNFFKQFKSIDYVINCAAYTKVDDCETQTDLANKINGTSIQYLAEATKKLNGIFIQISTDYVFNGQSTTPYTETDSPDPINAYGYSKWLGEKACQEHCPNHYILRVQWLYGQNGKHFVDTIKNLMQTRDTLNVINDQIGSLTCVESLSSYIITLIKNNAPFGIYNVSDQGYASWYDITLEIATLTNYKGTINPIPTTDYPLPAKRPANSRLDCSKLEQAIGKIRATWQNQLKTYIITTRETL